MTKVKSDTTNPQPKKPDAPDLKDVEPGSDADATPVAKPRQAPPDPNK